MDNTESPQAVANKDIHSNEDNSQLHNGQHTSNGNVTKGDDKHEPNGKEGKESDNKEVKESNETKEANAVKEVKGRSESNGGKEGKHSNELHKSNEVKDVKHEKATVKDEAEKNNKKDDHQAGSHADSGKKKHSENGEKDKSHDKGKESHHHEKTKDSHANEKAVGDSKHHKEKGKEHSPEPVHEHDGSDAKPKKKKWSFLGWLKKDKKDDDDHEHPKSTHGKSMGKSTNNKSGEDKEKEKEAEAESDIRDKKYIVVSTIDDFPEDCQKLIKQCGIPRDKLEAHFKILINVLHFRTGKIFKTPENVNDPPRPVLPKSARLKSGDELLTDAAEFKKLYKDMEELGKGGFGTVFQARSTKDKKKPVAIKRMVHKTRKQKTANFHEAAILNLCNHPNIVKYYTCHEIKDELWVVMELLEGGTFEDAAKAWHFSESNIAYIARELLKGIQYLHANELAHRDLKSANIMMSVRGEVKIIDLGLCADMSVGFPTHMVGSPFWMPPEMIQCKPHSYAVDIWSFAISLLEIANQRPPMIESAVKAMFTVGTEGVKDLFVEPNKWTEVFKDFLGMCLKMDPVERATAAQLLAHPFIKLADSRSNMENILRRIFLSNSLLHSGF